MKTKVDIISGFLGAGKTTLIKKLIEEQLQNEKLAIIENEFGKIGIDGSILKRPNIEVKELNSGCICCTLIGSFGTALEEIIITYKPDRIIIEPSGVGKLSDVLKACETPKLKELIDINMLITVIDVLKYQIYISNFGEFFENQIISAKTIILSKTQKADARKLELAFASIRKLNNKANIIITPWEILSAEAIMSAATQDKTKALENQVRKIVLENHSCKDGFKCNCNHEHMYSHKADEIFDVWGVETPKLYSENELKNIFNVIENDRVYGTVLRGKGIVQLCDGRWTQFDYIPGEFEIRDTAPDYTGRICVIGKGIKKDELYKLFQIKE